MTELTFFGIDECIRLKSRSTPKKKLVQFMVFQVQPNKIKAYACINNIRDERNQRHTFNFKFMTCFHRSAKN